MRPLLAELARAHLADERVPGRFSQHDLLRAFSLELSGSRLTTAERDEASHRLLDHYLYTGNAATLRAHPQRRPVMDSPPRYEIFDDAKDALRWLAAEREVVLASVRSAERQGFDVHAWRLAWTLASFLDQAGYWRDQEEAQLIALRSAERLRDPVALANADFAFALAALRHGRQEQAHQHFQRSRETFRSLGDRAGEAHAVLLLGVVLGVEGDFEEALEQARRALECFKEIDDDLGQARALNSIGWSQAKLGDYEGSLASCESSLRLHEKLDDLQGRAAAWDSLAEAHLHLGNHDEALECYGAAIELCRDLGDRYNEASTLMRLGDLRHSLGRVAAAREAWRRSLALFDKLEHPDAEQARDRLRRNG